MPFAVHTMAPGCPVVAIEKTAEEAAQTAERIGYDVGSARVLILPCAVIMTEACNVVDRTAQLELHIDDVRTALKNEKDASAAKIQRERERRDRAENELENVRKYTVADSVARMKKIRDGLSVAIDAVDPSKLILTRPTAQESA